MFVPVQHSFNWKPRFIPWVVCSKCGLIQLRNPFTDWAVKMGCNYEDHPDYETQRRSV